MNRRQFFCGVCGLLLYLLIILSCSVTGDKPVNTSGGANIGIVGWQWYQVMVGVAGGFFAGMVSTLFVVKLDLIKNRA
jgi:hypothetical protein